MAPLSWPNPDLRSEFIGVLLELRIEGFYPASADTSEMTHLGSGGVSWLRLSRFGGRVRT